MASKCWKGKAALFGDFCACFHSRDQCDLRSLISPHSFPGGDTDLARQTNTVTAAENADLLPSPGLCFLFQGINVFFYGETRKWFVPFVQMENAMKIWCDLMNNEYMLKYCDRVGYIHHLIDAKIASRHLNGEEGKMAQVKCEQHEVLKKCEAFFGHFPTSWIMKMVIKGDQSIILQLPSSCWFPAYLNTGLSRCFLNTSTLQKDFSLFRLQGGEVACVNILL